MVKEATISFTIVTVKVRIPLMKKRFSIGIPLISPWVFDALDCQLYIVKKILKIIKRKLVSLGKQRLCKVRLKFVIKLSAIFYCSFLCVVARN